MKPVKVPNAFLHCTFEFHSIGSRGFFSKRSLQDWTYKEYEKQFDEGTTKKTKHIKYMDDLDWIKLQEIPREVKNYVERLLADFKKNRNKNITARSTDESTTTFIIEGDNNGVVGNNVTKTIINQSSKRKNEGEPSTSRKIKRRTTEQQQFEVVNDGGGSSYEEEGSESEEELSNNDDIIEEIFQEGKSLQHTSFDTHQKRTYIYDYLTGVEKEWSPCQEWMIGELDITEVLTLYRQRSIKLASSSENLSDNRVLSLSNVFVVAPKQQDSCLHLFRTEYHSCIIKQYHQKQNWESLPFTTRKWCSRIDELMSSKATYPRSKIRALTRQFAVEADELHTSKRNDNNNDNNNKNNKNNTSGAHDENETDDEDEDNGELESDEDEDDELQRFAGLLGQLVQIFSSWSDDWVLENNYKKQHITPFIDHVLSTNINIREGESHLIDDAHSLMADYIGSRTASNKKIFDILCIEVKPPKKYSNWQLQSDFVKVGKEMKQMIDMLIDNGIEDVVVAGIVIEGYELVTYTMELVADGIYLMLERGRCRLLKSPSEISQVPQLYEYLLQIRNVLQPTIQKINNIASVTHSFHQSWKRCSAATPKRTDKKRNSITSIPAE